MSVSSFSTVVGVFNDQAVAEQAIDALTHAGIANDQIRYLAPGNSGGFFEALKSFFTGEEANGNPVHDLSHMGLSGSEVQYYSEAYNQGYIILAVNTSDYQGDVRGLLHHYGAYTPGFFPVPAGETPENAQQPEGVSAQEAENIHETPIYQSTMDAPMVEIHAVTHPPTPATPGQIDQVGDIETSDADADTLPDLTPVVASNTDADTLPDLRSVEVDDEITERSDVKDPAAMGGAPIEEDKNEIMETDDAAMDITRVEIDELETFDAETNGVYPQQANTLQEMQHQIQTTRQQLQEAQAQLEALKQHETQYAEAQQQLQALRAELQATQLELQEAKERVTQYH